MAIINLRRYYPHYPKDKFLEVPDEVAEALEEGRRIKISNIKINPGRREAEPKADVQHLYAVLGDSDNATESAQLMAQLARSEEDVAKWGDIAAGVTGTFGDALPINSLIEASNETAKVGEVTGALADALNWVGISEDAFNEISELQKQIGTYGKTREIYAQYRKLAGKKREKFYEQHSGEITACQAAKWYVDSLGLKKLPFIQSLKQEYATLYAENRKRYPEYKQAKAKMIELLTAKNNVERILGVTEKEKNRDRQQEAR